MTANKLREWLEVVGLFSVVASLVFVGLQMKQSHEIALSQASQARVAMAVDTLVSTAENSLFVSAQAKGLTGEEQSPEEKAAMGQYGLFAEERWQASKEALKGLLRDASTIPVRRAYERRPERYSGSFQTVVDGLISEIDSTDRPK